MAANSGVLESRHVCVPLMSQVAVPLPISVRYYAPQVSSGSALHLPLSCAGAERAGGRIRRTADSRNCRNALFCSGFLRFPVNDHFWRTVGNLAQPAQRRKCLLFHSILECYPRHPGRILNVRICCQKVWNCKLFSRDMFSKVFRKPCDSWPWTSGLYLGH